MRRFADSHGEVESLRTSPSTSTPTASTGRGHGALIRWIERWLEAWDDAWDEVDEIVQTGDVVVAAIRVHGRGRRSGMVISQRLFDVFELRDGRVVRVTEYLDRHLAFEAAGIPG
jgi:ketosteroid isomerase-like protein